MIVGIHGGLLGSDIVLRLGSYVLRLLGLLGSGILVGTALRAEGGGILKLSSANGTVFHRVHSPFLPGCFHATEVP